MIAILVKKVTKYDCNDDHNGDLIWLQSKFQKGLNMIAIQVFKRTIYDCNPFQYRPNMAAIFKIVLDPRDYYARRISRKEISNDCSHIRSIFERITFVYGSFENRDCNHISSPFWSSLQSYLVPFLSRLQSYLVNPYSIRNLRTSKSRTVGPRPWIWLGT